MKKWKLNFKNLTLVHGEFKFIAIVTTAYFSSLVFPQ